LNRQRSSRLEAEIANWKNWDVGFPALFTEHPARKATDALVDRHSTLSDAEEEWLLLEEKPRTSFDKIRFAAYSLLNRDT
jgi:ATP-binding cassette subfamily F protein uup